MRLGIVQYWPTWGDPRGNLERVESLIGMSRAEVVVLPELAFTGYLFETRDELNRLAEPIPEGQAFQHIQSISKRKNIAIIYGFPELEGDSIFNSAIFVTPKGEYYIYRKVHLFGREKFLFERGKTFSVFTYRDVKFGIIICYDWAFPESVRVLALKGAQVILHPSNLILPYAQEAMKIRALENHVFVVTSNRIGEDRKGNTLLRFRGESQVVDPKGRVLKRAGNEETYFEVEIDPQMASSKILSEGNDLFNDRIPSSYKRICKEGN